MQQQPTTLQHMYQFELELTPIACQPDSSDLDFSPYSPKRELLFECLWPRAFGFNQRLRVRIPSITDSISAITRVLACNPTEQGYQLTLAFDDGYQAFQLRMLEQLCHIRHYHAQLQRDGSGLSLNEAAQNWIKQFGESFPSTSR
ncbi:hypothetical protein [Motiliproteus sp.]|uniref:hypothetical protein n=1 Tax=Motiliproteus sp. TaxID=1898955 RepID=UPI003BAC49E6